MENSLRERFEQIRLNAQPGFGTTNELMQAAYDLAKAESEECKWVPIITETDISRTVCLFDTGEMCFYNQEFWPRAEVIAIFELPNPPQQ